MDRHGANHDSAANSRAAAPVFHARCIGTVTRSGKIFGVGEGRDREAPTDSAPRRAWVDGDFCLNRASGKGAFDETIDTNDNAVNRD